MPYAVGTGLAYIMGMSSVSAWRHRKSGNIEVKLGLALGLSMLAGVKFGELTMKALAQEGQADFVVRLLYIVMLLSLGLYMMYESIRARVRNTRNAEGTPAVAPLQKLPWQPHIDLGTDGGASISFWPVAGIGLGAGFLTGILGVGGGFILMPIMIYLIGIPTISAVGTSLMCLLIASPFGVLVYHLNDMVLFKAALLMIGGALIGAPLGVHASHKVHGRNLRLLYAIMITIGGISVILRQVGAELAARIVITSAAGGMAALIMLLTVLANMRSKQESGSQTVRGAGRT
jgi:uncharacterized membrane protein YfcA